MLERLSDREVFVRTRHSRRLVQHDESPLEPARTDRRLYSQPKSDRLGHVARFHVTNSLEDVAGVREQAASEDSIQRESQLVVDREQAVAPQRACLKYRIAARVFDYVSIRIALGDYNLRSRFLKSEAAQIASASPKEPLGNWKRLFSAKGRCQPEPHANRKHGVAKFVNRIEAIVLDKQLDELLAAAKCSGREVKAAQSLIARSRIESVVTFVAQEARPYSPKPDRLRVSLNLRHSEILRQVEDADSLEVVAHINDE